MNIGILTFHYSNNAGAVLQAYGLAQAVRNLGHDVQIIDYRPWAARRAVQGHWLRYPLSLLRHPAAFCEKTATRRAFHEFRKSCLPLTRTYKSWEELKNDPPRLDAAVCGSDQVWNIAGDRGFDPAFFLDFKEEGLRRVSYAATFGHVGDLGAYRTRIAGLLGRFNALSVRDLPSQRLVEELTGRSPAHVLDPSFLANYESLIPPPLVASPYIFLFCFCADATTAAAVRALRARFNMPVVSTGMSALEGVSTVRFGPRQWLSLLKHARFVCTNSFHGVCFSLVHQKPFIVLPMPGRMSRIEDVLQTAGLADRIVSGTAALEPALANPIDYPAVSERINAARERSLAFLREALR